MDNKYSINFYLDRPYLSGNSEKIKECRKNKGKVDKNFLVNEKRPVYLYFYLDGKLSKVRLNLEIYPKQWDFKQQRVNSTNAKSDVYNDYLDELTSDAMKAYKEVIRLGHNYDSKQALELIKAKILGQEPKTIVPVYIPDVSPLFIKEKENLKKRTIEKYEGFFRRLELFQEYIQRKVKINEIDIEFINDYSKYLNEVRGIHNATVTKYQQCPKVFIRWAIEKEYLKDLKFNKVHTYKYSNDKLVALSLEELQKIMDLDLSKFKKLELWRDRYVFACHTGQRFSDIEAFDLGNVVMSDRGKTWNLFQVKGQKNELLTLPLHDNCVKIMEKHADGRQVGKIFGTVANQTFNEALKVIAEMAGLDRIIMITSFKGKGTTSVSKPLHEVLTSHTARATFVTISLNSGMPAEMVMKMTGHTKVEVMRKYIKLATYDLADCYQKYWK